MEFSRYINECWELASNSDCKKMKFGSVIVIEGNIIGRGYNHVAHPSLNDLCNPCIRQGVLSGTRAELCTAIHAEQAAIIDAHKNTRNLSEATLYVAGINSDGSRFVKDSPFFYCTVCVRLIAGEEIDRIVVPTVDGDAALFLPEALKTAFEFARGLRVKE